MIQFNIFSVLLLFLAGGFLVKPFKPGFAKIKFLLFILFSLIAVLIYSQMGRIKQWQQVQINEAEVRRMLQELQTPERVITRLRERLAEQPNSAKGWYLLGRLYRSIQQFDDAVTAFRRAYDLASDEPDHLNSLLEAKYWENGGYYFETDLSLLQNQRARDLLNTEVLNLLAGHYYQHQQYDQAITYWRKMSNKVNDDLAVQQEVMKAIEKSQERLEKQQGVNLSVELNVTSELKRQFPLNATVFVFAKSSKQGPPLAAVKRYLSELPTTVHLTDAEAMLSLTTLSKRINAQVTVFARIEPSGKLSLDARLPETYEVITLKPKQNSVALALGGKVVHVSKQKESSKNNKPAVAKKPVR